MNKNPIFETQRIINQYIAFPMAITVFKQDKEKFEEFKLGNLYLDMLDSIIERMERDFYRLKADLYKVHGLDVKKLGNGRFEVNTVIVEFSPEELKEMTRQLMSDYLYGDNAAEFERTDRGFTS